MRYLWILLILSIFILLMFWYYYMVVSDPCSHPIPEYLVERQAGGIKDHYDRRVYYSNQWGSPEIDGPDRCMPDMCFWDTGVLHCRSPSVDK